MMAEISFGLKLALFCEAETGFCTVLTIAILEILSTVKLHGDQPVNDTL